MKIEPIIVFVLNILQSGNSRGILLLNSHFHSNARIPPPDILRHWTCSVRRCVSAIACSRDIVSTIPLGCVWSVNSDSAIAIIPARYQSTRLPGKPVIEIRGKTLIEHVYRRVEQAELVERILVATDDERIAEAVQRFGGNVIMTRIDHQSGTDRLAEAAAEPPADALIVNVQGDEPLIEPEVIDRAVAAARLGDAEIVTLMTRLDRPCVD